MISYSANHNLSAISATSRETAINTFRAVDLSLLSDIGDVVKLVPRRESNQDEANGKEEPDLIYDNGYTAETTRNHNRAQPQHFAYLFGYGLGNVVTTAAGTGYLHTITPISGGVDLQRELPSLTMLTRMGKTVLKRRLASMFVDQVTATFAADDWVKINGTLKGTGKHSNNVVEESITAAGNATSLNLATRGVEGSTAGERLDNVQRIKVELTSGVWTEVVYSAVSSATPAVITMTAPAVAATPVTYKVMYIPIEGTEFDFPAQVIESPLRVSEMSFNLGGSWNGTTFAGGKALGAEIKSIECSFNNASAISFVPGGGGAFASMHERGQRSQSLKVDRRFMDFILQQHLIDNDQLGARILAVGAEFDTGHNYQVEIIYPKLGLLSADPAVADRKMTESGQFTVLEDATYGSVIVKVKNLWAGYAG